ncbi:MAG: hypothetical protein AVDCRST_MAG68-1600, partial [uncultured Gemmatimonadetes bacterium]
GDPFPNHGAAGGAGAGPCPGARAGRRRARLHGRAAAGRHPAGAHLEGAGPERRVPGGPQRHGHASQAGRAPGGGGADGHAARAAPGGVPREPAQPFHHPDPAAAGAGAGQREPAGDLQRGPHAHPHRGAGAGGRRQRQRKPAPHQPGAQRAGGEGAGYRGRLAGHPGRALRRPALRGRAHLGGPEQRRADRRADLRRHHGRHRHPRQAV